MSAYQTILIPSKLYIGTASPKDTKNKDSVIRYRFDQVEDLKRQAIFKRVLSHVNYHLPHLLLWIIIK